LNTLQEIKHYGTILDTDVISYNDQDKNVIKQISHICRNSDTTIQSQHPVIPFPTVSTEPEDEYEGIPIFSNAFPWLFPGGIGDITCNKKKENGYVQKWVANMVHYFDGRFVTDPTWCFYALNYLQRHQNNISGGFFVRDFIKSDKPLDVDELKRQVQNGDYSFIEKIIYFSSKIRGSDSYWRMKKSQLYSWVYWHIEQGNGAPTLFITLSCAEYYWPDVKRLLQDRINIARGNPSSDNDDELTSKAKIMKAVNQYSIVVQEYFIAKVKDWMETYAKEVFKIKHWYARFEFAKGRGEIHAHILAIADNKTTFSKAYKAKTDAEKVEIISNYAQDVLGLTSEFKQFSINIERQMSDTQELKKSCKNDVATQDRLASITKYDDDIINLCLSCQTHKCGNYCMKYNTKNSKVKNRYCRAGCGYEATEGKCDTPGFQLQENHKIKKDINGTKRILLKRDDTKIIQTSTKTLQSWRSNCDVQLILYDSDPAEPNLGELAKVTDYVVSYACKGNCTHEAEKQALADIVLR